MNDNEFYPKVSCIIPMYNSENYIKETIESVLSQTYENIELIIVDDSSTDNSIQTVKRFREKIDPNIVLLQNPNKGACAARNYGLGKSTGQYIQFLDADDILDENKIMHQIMGLKNKSLYTLASCRWGKFYNNIDDVRWENQLINKSYSNPIDWLSDSWNGNGVGQTGIWLCSKELIYKAGLWNESLRINQDGDFFARVIFEADEIIYFDKAKVYYRTLANSISQGDKFNREKASSLLKSYILYRENANKYNKIESLKKGIANKFLMFIYQYNGVFDDLCVIARSEFDKLGYNKMWPVGGIRFKILAYLIGANNVFRLKNLLKK